MEGVTQEAQSKPLGFSHQQMRSNRAKQTLHKNGPQKMFSWTKGKRKANELASSWPTERKGDLFAREKSNSEKNDRVLHSKNQDSKILGSFSFSSILTLRLRYVIGRYHSTVVLK